MTVVLMLGTQIAPTQSVAAEQRQSGPNTLAEFVEAAGGIQARSFGICVEAMGAEFLQTEFRFASLQPLNLRTSRDVQTALKEAGFSTQLFGDVVLITDPKLAGATWNPLNLMVSPIAASGTMTEVVTAVSRSIRGKASGSVVEHALSTVRFQARPIDFKTDGSLTLREILLTLAQKELVDWKVQVSPEVPMPSGTWPASFSVRITAVRDAAPAKRPSN